MDLSQDFIAVRQNSWNLLRATGLWTRVLANDVYGFHAWQCECLRSFKIGLPRVWPRTSDTPAALPWTLSHLPCSWLARCRALPARKSFSWQRVLWPQFWLRLPRRGEHSSPVCLHALPAQQSQQQQQSGPQQIRADRYVEKSNWAELNCCSINGYKILTPSCKSAITHTQFHIYIYIFFNFILYIISYIQSSPVLYHFYPHLNKKDCRQNHVLNLSEIISKCRTTAFASCFVVVWR